MDLGTVTTHRAARGRADLALAPGEALLAGGTWLFSEPQETTTGLVDLTALGWPDLEPLPDGGLRIGATCPIARLADTVDRPLVAQCAEALVMSSKVQETATVGGNLCLALPAGAMTSLLAALDATAVIWTPDGGERREPVAGFVRGVRSTSLRAGEVLRAVDVRAGALAAASAYRRIGLTRLGRSASVVIATALEEGVRVTITAATTRPVVVGSLAEVDAVDCWYADAHGAADWRAAVTRVLVAEVLEELR